MPGQPSRQVYTHFGLEVYQSLPVRGVWRLQTPRGDKCLKRSQLPYVDILFAYHAIEHLHRHGFDRVPRFQPTITGKPFLQLNGTCYILSDWIEGQECDYTRPEDLARATWTLAELHLAAHGFQPPLNCADKMRWGQWPSIFRHRRQELLYFRHRIESGLDRSPTGRYYHKHLPHFLSQSNIALALLAGSRYQSLVKVEQKQQLFCHHDFAHHNVLLTPGGRTYVVDFDYAICDLRLHDVGSLIIRALKLNDWDYRVADFVLATYNQVYPLPVEALPVMLAFFYFPQDFWQVGVWLYLEQVTWPNRAVERKLERTIRMEKKRIRFLQHFAGLVGRNTSNIVEH
ncbi:MAG: CotS family spore coat protein [Firmicutes bacterium]|nr:CotS family spore coat protein [Bacillota bacterium]